MFLMESLAGFDLLSLGVIVGSALLLASLIWALIDNRQFEDFKPAANHPEADANRPEADDVRPEAGGSSPREPRTPRAA
jgi:hypothetical protein